MALLVIKGKDNLSGVLEVLNWGGGWEELVPDKDNEFQERLELDCPAVGRTLGVLAGPETEVKAQLYQVIDVEVLGVRGRGSHGHHGLDNAEGGGLLLINGGSSNL